MGGFAAYIRSLDPRLPRAVWTMEAGGLANAFGNGITFPFVVIYLHSVRDVSQTAAGLVLAFHSLVSLASGPVVGLLVDRIGARRTLAGGLVLMAVGWGAFPLVRETWHAFVLAGIAGMGNGGFWPSQSALLAGLTPQPRRHVRPPGTRRSSFCPSSRTTRREPASGRSASSSSSTRSRSCARRCRWRGSSRDSSAWARSP